MPNKDPRLSAVILTLVEMSAATVGEIAEAVLRAADEASYRCTICGGIVSYHDVDVGSVLMADVARPTD